jgi:hypothetical protein
MRCRPRLTFKPRRRDRPSFFHQGFVGKAEADTLSIAQTLALFDPHIHYTSAYRFEELGYLEREKGILTFLNRLKIL